MADNNIIKALECHSLIRTRDPKGTCKECPYKQKTTCMEEVIADTIALINCLEAEIEDLQRIVGLMNSRKYYRKFVDEVFRKQEGKELSDPDFDYIYQLFFEQKAELERYKQCLPYLEHQSIDFCGIPCNFMEGIVEKARAEAIKEFKEKLKEEEVVRPNCVYEMSEEGLYNYIKVMEGESE